tara:strand:+ start:1115 stop:1612 length:498 start_codon:yes stop_codon:yes gene_type:complete
MWLVAKYKKKELSLLKKNLSEKLGEEIKFYHPKIKIQKFKNNKLIEIKKSILEDYIFFYHESFKNDRLLLNLRNIRGLKYFLENCKQTQREIIHFIDKCKKNETNGFLNQKFFDQTIKDKAMFVSGPLTGMIFKIIENQGKKIKALIGNLETTIDRHPDYLYRSV